MKEVFLQKLIKGVHPVDKTMVFQSSMLHVMVLSKLSWHELLQRFHAVDEMI